MSWRGNSIVVLAAALVALTGIGGASAARTAGPAWPYQVYRPASLSKAQRVPLVVIPSGDNNYMINTTRFDQAADKFGFVVVYAQIVKSYNDVARIQGENVSSPYPDMLFLSDVIDKVTASDNIDPNRVYMTGFSLGGSTSYRAGCILASKLAGIAPVAGVFGNPKCIPSRPVSIFAINGTSDTSYTGTSEWMPATQAVATWRGFDGCSSTPTSSSASGAVTTQTFDSCRSGAVVQQATIASGTHIWPGEPGLAHTSPDGQLDATTAISQFILAAPHASSAPPAGAKLSAKLGRVTVKAKPRSLVVRLVSNAGGTVQASLLHSSKAVYRRSFKAANGTTTFRLAIPSTLKRGSYTLTLALKTHTGSTVLHRAVRLPAA